MTRTIEADGVSPVTAFWKRRWVLIPAVAVIALGAATFGYRSGGSSTVEMGVYLTDPRGVPIFRDGSSAPADLASHSTQRANFAQSINVLSLVERETGVDVATLREQVRTVASTTGSFAVYCVNESAESAQEICRSIVSNYEILSQNETKRRADVTITALEADRVRLTEAESEASAAALDQIDIQITQAASIAALVGSGVEFVEEIEPITASKVRPAIQLGLAGAAFAILVLGAVAWWRAASRPVVSTSRQAADILKGTVVGSVRSNGATDYELIATNLDAAGLPHVLAVVRTQPSRDKDPLVAFELAVTLARSHRSVLLIDGDVMERRLAKRFGCGKSEGLTELISGTRGLDRVVLGVGIDRGVAVTLIVAGTAAEPAASLFRSEAARKVLSDLAHRYEVVIIDTPSIVTSAEGAALAAVADGAVVVASSHSLLVDVEATSRRMELLKTPFAGVIFEHTSR